MATQVNVDIRSMSFLELLDFIDSLHDEITVSVRLRNALSSSTHHKNFPFASIGEYLDAGDTATKLLMRIPNFGRKTVRELRDLVQKAVSVVGLDISKYDPMPLSNLALSASGQKITFTPTQLATPIVQLALPPKYYKLIRKISEVIGSIVTVQDIMNFQPSSFTRYLRVGKLYDQLLIDLQKELPSALEAQQNKFIPLQSTDFNFNEIDNVFIEDIESYLWTLDEIKMDIALSRWGFNHDYETLEEVASRYNLTRERIRQIEVRIDRRFLLHLRILPKTLWTNIRERMTDDLTVLLPNLAKCFATDKLFYAFIELCCQVEAGSISKIIFTKVRSEIINSLFCSTPSPVAQEVIINELMSNYGYDKASAIHGIRQLAKLNKIEVNEEGVYPKNLPRAQAIAHTLTFHPEGLPWKDIVRIINKKGYAIKAIDENRATHGFNDSEYVYLCAKGTFRHLMFLDIEQLNIPKIIQYLIDYFKQKQIKVLHLHDYYYQTKGQHYDINYFTLRHLVREYGEEYGLYFDGQSGSESISLDSDSKRITQADVIIKVLNESKVAMTKQEIAERLKSKSAAHAGFYISNLMEEGRVVRVDKTVYTTPEKAFSSIDINAVMLVIQEILNVKNVIVEADVFREYVNMELNFSYSKYFYAALVNTQIKELGWHRQNTLFSKNPIPYRNLLDACKQLCNATLANDENTKILQQVVWLSDAVTTAAIQQWRLYLTTQVSN